MAGIENTARVLFDMVGKEGKRVLNKEEFLNEVAKLDETIAREIERGVKKVTNPTFEISGKATANYNVASLKIKNAQGDVVGGGACSVSNYLRDYFPDLKCRLDLPDGNSHRGFNLGKYSFQINGNGERTTMFLNDGTSKVARDKFCTKLNKGAYGHNEDGSRCVTMINSNDEVIEMFTVAGDGSKKVYLEILPDYTEVNVEKEGTRCFAGLVNRIQGIEYALHKDRYGTRIDGYGNAVFSGMKLGKDKRITSVNFFNELAFDPQKFIGKKLTPKLQKKLGIRQMFKAMRNMPIEEIMFKINEKRILKQCGEDYFSDPGRYVGWNYGRRKKPDNHLIEKVEAATQNRKQPVSPAEQREQTLKDTAGMSFRDLLKLAFSRKKKPNSDIMQKLESAAPEKKQPVSPAEQREQIVKDTAGMSFLDIVKSLFNNK